MGSTGLSQKNCVFTQSTATISPRSQRERIVTSLSWPYSDLGREVTNAENSWEMFSEHLLPIYYNVSWEFVHIIAYM